MKILHTADWHLGKRLEGKSRFPEQAEVLEEIFEIAEREKADLVIVSGDVFDAFVPPAEAERLFYESALRLSRLCPVVIISGNHDDPARLAAPGGLAGAMNIYLVGQDADMSGVSDERFTGGDGILSFTKDGERVNIALLPYPDTRTMEISLSDGDLSEVVKKRLDKCAEGFLDGFNITAAHLFITGGAVAGDERTLGPALLLPVSVLPAADCTLLGHIHKPMTVSKSKKIYYSGSILSYHFDDAGEKSVGVVDTKTGGYTRVPLTRGKRLFRVEADNIEEALAKLDELGDSAFAEVLYSGAPLTPGDMTRLREREAFCRIHILRSDVGSDKLITRREERSPGELFKAFYLSKTGSEPSGELVELFEEICKE